MRVKGRLDCRYDSCPVLYIFVQMPGNSSLARVKNALAGEHAPRYFEIIINYLSSLYYYIILWHSIVWAFTIRGTLVLIKYEIV